MDMFFNYTVRIQGVNDVVRMGVFAKEMIPQ